MDLYLETSYKLSKVLTKRYSTSFSLGIMLFPKKYQDAIYAIYGFVRLADEIVDTFHDHDKSGMLRDFRQETYRAIESRISMNPILHSFQHTVHEYGIKKEYIDAFLHSMEMDLTEHSFDRQLYEEYVYGSAEVVGLMCLQIFCRGQAGLFEDLVPSARKLGSAFQKVNFLRDIRSDLDIRRRIYLPDVHETTGIDNQSKAALEIQVGEEFREALAGIKRLPVPVRWGVFTAYRYYWALFEKIKSLDVRSLMATRVRVSNAYKIFLLVQSYFLVKKMS